MTPSIKFCGMTRREDIEAAEKLGVGFIGFVFARSSPRRVTSAQAKRLRLSVKNACVVGVFTDHSLAQINRFAKDARLDYVQLHGTPNLALCSAVCVPVIQAFQGVPSEKTLRAFSAKCAYLLIDKAPGEDALDIDVISRLPKEIRAKLFIAGGLKPSTVREAARSIEPFGVDCARGIESKPGVKDLDLMCNFISSLCP